MTVNLFIGTSGWNYADWKRRFYPDDLKSKEFLSFYAKQFRTTEVNSSFYHLPKTTTCQNWAAQVPNDFVFAVKASRFITHIRRLKEATDAWRAFLEHTSALGRKRGPILLQFPPSFRKDTELLAAFLQGGSQIESVDDIHLAFEFRHSSWFDQEVYGILAKQGSALVIAHSQRYPQAPFVPTSGFVYLRLHGPGTLFASSYTDGDLRHWAADVRAWIDSGRSVYVYFNNDYQGFALENARRLIDMI
jgi:uncharacterized protein YecE (DUF72 family)